MWEMVAASREARWRAGRQGWEIALLSAVYPFLFLIFYYVRMLSIFKSDKT